jgi:hypothetical protein
MHMKANLLDGVDDVRAGERQVLEVPDEAPKLSQIINRRPESGRDLGLRVHGRRDQLAVHHASVLKDIKSEMALSEEGSMCLMMYEDPQKMVKNVDVLHGKFLLEGGYGVLQERCARCSVHNVINIKQQVYRIDAAAEDKQGGVGFGLNKSQSEEVRGKLTIPSLRCLLQPIERLVQAADPVRLCKINKSRQLVAVDCL